MFVAIYRFEVKQGKEDVFIKAWHDLTELIYKYEGSLGSRLHKDDNGIYIAYAQWPDRKTWENAGNKLPEKANNIRNTMRIACNTIETVYELDCVDDLLK